MSTISILCMRQATYRKYLCMSHTIYHYCWHELHFSKYIFNTSIALKIKSSSPWVILLSSAKGQSFILMLSHHLFFENFLESIIVILSVMCLSQNAVICGITMMLLPLISLHLVFTWTSEVPWHLCFAPQLRAEIYHSIMLYYDHYNLVDVYKFHVMSS